MLETENLILRFHTIHDAPFLMELNSDPDVIKYTGDVGFTDLSQSLKIIQDRMIPQQEKYKMGRFAVCDKNNNYLGWCGLRFFPEDDEIDLGYRFLKKYWGMGYATEASRASLAYGFKTLGLKRIIAKAMPENIGSIKVMQKLGMNFRGVHKDPQEAQAFIVYEMTREEYLKCEK